MRLSIEEQVCLECGNSAMQLVSMSTPYAASSIGRFESLEVTCMNSRPEKHIKQDVLFNLVQNHYANVVHGLCYDLFNKPWMPGFEIMLWEALHNASDSILLSAEEILRLKSLYENTKLWFISPNSWSNRIASPTVNFVAINEWYEMYTNRDKLFKTHEPSLPPSPDSSSGKPSEDPEFER